MDIEQTLRLGVAAKSLMESEAFKEALEGVRREAYGNWLVTQPSDTQIREEFYYLTLAVAHLEQKLRGYITNARIEQDNRDRMATKAMTEAEPE